jgi:predicted metal-dependent phosphoesterase TrpH
MNQIQLNPDFEFHPISDDERSSTDRRWQRRGGTRIDLHCHSTFSDERIKWLPNFTYHPVLMPGEVYDLAKSRGMDFVTLTDHDTITGCLALLDERGPLDDFIVGEEVSIRFPEDGTVIHVNVFDHDEAQHREIQRLRENIYDCIAYLRTIDKLFVINHLTWTAQHRVLKPWQLEVMLDLFPVFEGLNGARSYAHNAFAWYATQGRDKVLVAGSDSHTRRVGTTYTLTQGESRAEVIRSIRDGIASPCGAFGTPDKLADDVLMVMQAELDRRVQQANHVWQRGIARLTYTLANQAYPLICRGYQRRQNTLIQGFVEALNTLNMRSAQLG